MITRLDTAVGQIMAKLKEYKLDEDTLILFTSDNGPHQEGGNNPAFFRSAGPFKGIKGNLYEGGLRVPMIARWTGKIKPNTVTEEPFAHWDVLPTCFQRRGFPNRARLMAYPLPTLLGREQLKNTISSTGKCTSTARNRPRAKATGRSFGPRLARP